MRTFKSIAAAAVMTTLPLAFTAAHAQDDLALEAGVQTVPASIAGDVARPRLVEATLYWRDHALSGLCRDFGGRFAKLNGAPVYACALDGSATAAVPSATPNAG
ncbi:MAG: hypothetical protein ACTS3R_13575 [Inquilinaceae bacterium]